MSAENEQEFILEGAEEPRPDVADDDNIDDDIEEEIEADEPPARRRVVGYKALDDIEYEPLEQRDDVKRLLWSTERELKFKTSMIADIINQKYG